MSKVSAFIVLGVALGAAFGAALHLDAQATPERKVTARIAPIYPALARRTHARGLVRLEVSVRANGSIKSTRVLGGNPVLANAASEAVGKWKFEPSPGETTEIVELRFEQQ
jgi:TonB family protein